MLLLDVNVVVAAHRGDHPEHEAVRGWFDAVVAGGEDFGVPLTVWASFLRLVTNRRIFTVPTPLPEAFAFVDAVRGQAGHLVSEPGIRHLALLRRLAENAAAAGDLIPDAVLGALAVEHGARIATLDRDFARFPDVRTVDPRA